MVAKPGHREHVANASHYIYYCTGSLSPLSAYSRSPKTTCGSAGSLDQKIPFAAHHGYTTTVKSTSMDSFTPIAGISAGGNVLMVTPELNGETRSYSDSSGLNSISENASLSSYEKVRTV